MRRYLLALLASLSLGLVALANPPATQQPLLVGGTLFCIGGTITTSGTKRIHTFTTSGTLSCSGTGQADALVVGGGGGAGAGLVGNECSAGGSAGQVLPLTAITISGSISVTVGAGGTVAAAPSDGTTGGSSILGSLGTAIGGGGGEGTIAPGTSAYGGGAFGNRAGTGTGTGATGTIANKGGNGFLGNGNTEACGGGGGAGGSAANASSNTPTQGGLGTNSSITGSSICYGGGGPGAGAQTQSTGALPDGCASGGLGGVGGAGGSAPVAPAANRGIGGPGGALRVNGVSSDPGLPGGTGVVIVAY